MRASGLFINTLRDAPAEAEVASHQLMLRAGFIMPLAAGIFTWQPLGLRVVRKIEAIVREEMNAAGAAEVLMPAVQPAELWHESGRWQLYGKELLRLQDRHERDYCIGPTHEEVITDLVRRNVTSWRQLPVNLYQIQTKFRDEIRPRYGVMRAREFVMKDAYSFDRDTDGAMKSYQAMRAAYSRMFDRIGLEYCIVPADSGAIGGNLSEEFLVLADSGEAQVARDGDGYVNLDQLPCPGPDGERPAAGMEMKKIDTPGVGSIEELREFLDEPPPLDRCVKTMTVAGENGVAAVLLAGDAQLNLAKAGHHPAIGAGARLAEEAEVRDAVGAGFGSLGPVGMKLPVVADQQLRTCADFACGANEDGKHLLGVNFGRDCPEPEFADLRMAQPGDRGADGQELQLRRGIEVGHIFYLGTKYSAALKASFESEGSGARTIDMGCYGIGITRIVAAAIEQGNDERGIILPDAIAPFSVAVLPLGQEEAVQAAAQELYANLRTAGVDVLLDDRGLRAGPAFSDLDLVGIPHRLVVSKRSLAENAAEYKHRRSEDTRQLPLAEAAAELVKLTGG